MYERPKVGDLIYDETTYESGKHWDLGMVLKVSSDEGTTYATIEWYYDDGSSTTVDYYIAEGLETPDLRGYMDYIPLHYYSEMRERYKKLRETVYDICD